MKIRPANPSDIPGLVGLWTELMDSHIPYDPSYTRSDDAVDNWVKYVKTRLEDGDCEFFVAENGGQLVGYVGVAVKEYPPVFEVLKYGFIEEICVTRAFRQQGVGGELAEAAEKWLRAKDITEFNVKIDVENEASLALFKGRGFRVRTQTLTRNN